MNTNQVIDEDGTQRWLLNGKLHREDGGPAIITADGTQKWFVNGKLHRLDGPVIIYADGLLEWCINGKYITHEVEKWMRKNKITYPFNSESLVMFKLKFG